MKLFRENRVRHLLMTILTITFILSSTAEAARPGTRITPVCCYTTDDSGIINDMFWVRPAEGESGAEACASVDAQYAPDDEGCIEDDGPKPL